MATQKIALITNGVTPGEPDALETQLRQTGREVEVFDVRTMHQTAGGFVRDADGSSIDPTGYGAVARIIQGGVTGDTEKSWALQKSFEDAGAKPHIGIEAARKITDKILCREQLAGKKLPIFPAIALPKAFSGDEKSMADQIETLGSPPYIVRKSIGSGAQSLRITDSVPEAVAAVEHYLPESGVIIHPRPLALDAATAAHYGIEAADAEKRTYQFRVMVVDGKIFGANIAYSQPDGFGLNAAQGAVSQPVPLESMPPEVLKLARRAADAHTLKIAAIDIALDAKAQPRVLDMNASPDLSFTNERGEKLSTAVTQSIGAMVAIKGPFTSLASLNRTGIPR